MKSIQTWRAYTSEERFATKLNQITAEFKEDNELRTEKLEAFMIDEGIQAGVIKVHT
jgi:hypothetical protein